MGSSGLVVDLFNETSLLVTKLLVAAVIMLLGMHVLVVNLADQMGEDHFVTSQLVRLFSLDQEYNVPSWFSSVLLWTSGTCLLAIAHLRQRGKENYSRHWIVLGLVFLLMSMDESIVLHEWLISPVRNAFGVSGFLYFAWIIPAAVFLVILGIFYVPFLLYVPWNLRVLIVVSGLLYVGGAIGLEMIGGAARSGTIENSIYPIVMPIEEISEMLGIVLFIHGLVAVLVGQKTRDTG